MAIEQEWWVGDIQPKLFSGDNEFMLNSVDHTEFVDGKTVHVPQAGSIPAVAEDRAIVPAVITQRTDTDLTYDLINFTTDPILVQFVEELQTSYAKRNSVMSHHIDKIKDRMALRIMRDWSSDTAANQVRTTGSSVGTNLAPGATGTRKQITVADIATAAKLMTEQNVPRTNRFLLLPAAMYYELFQINDLIKEDIIGTITLPPAVVNKILGFNVILRSTTVIYDNTGTPLRKALDAATATDDNFGAVAWHSDFVSNAMGDIMVRENNGSGNGDATFYGNVLSAEVQQRGAKLRTDEAGIVTLIQAA